MRFVPRHLVPLPRPTLKDARVLGDVGLEARLTVSVGAVGFLFERHGEDWTGGAAITLGRGQEVDEAWLQVAREVATEALKAELVASGGEEPVETVPCPECGRILCSPLLVGAGDRRGVDCGPAHVLRFAGGQQLVFNPDGTSAWAQG